MRATDSLARIGHKWQLSPFMAIALAALGLCDLVGALALGSALFPSEGVEAQLHPDWRPPNLAQLYAGEAKPAGSYAQTLNRPIFSKTRRPSISEQAQIAPASDLPPPGNLRLAALTKVADHQRAYVVSASTGKWCDIGDQIDGWTITQIQNAAVVLKNGARTFNLPLYPDPSAPKPPGNAALGPPQALD